MAAHKPRVGSLTPAQVKARRTRRWLTTPSGLRLRLPPELQGASRQKRAGRAAWEAMHVAGDEVAAAEERDGGNSRSTQQARMRARRAQDELLSILGLTREELVTTYARGTPRGRNALALGRY